MPNYRIVKFDEVKPVPCPCGVSRRAFLDDPDRPASMHLLQVDGEAATHYHKNSTELYLVLEGEGRMDLDGEPVPVGPMTALMIKPGCRHRAVGKLKIIVVPIPAFDPDDEWTD